MDSVVFNALSLALGLGLLIGLQRERAASRLGGIRTFPLIALLGAICGLLAADWGVAIVVAGFVGVIAMAVLANLDALSQKRDIEGQTTEAAALITYMLGAFLALEYYAAAIVVGGVTAVLLQFKRPLHEFAGELTDNDLRAMMRFVVISLIILPVLPDTAYGPYQVLNPREIWWMVVLIVGIGLTGYVSYKAFRSRTGAVIGGMLGGLVSSTATTVAYARRVGASADAAALAALMIAIAWTTSVVRVMVEVAVVAPASLVVVAPPLAVLLVLMTAATAAMLRFAGSSGSKMPEPENPAELRTALIFAALYALVIFAAAAAKDYFGTQALYVVAVVSGLVDVDAITLSTAQLAAAGRIDADTAARVILLATLTNIGLKACVVLALGSRKLFARLLPVTGVALIGGAALLVLWPAMNAG